MTLINTLGLVLALALAYLGYVFVRLGFPQRLALLLRMRGNLSGILEESSRRHGDKILIELQETIAWAGAYGANWSANQILTTSIRLSSIWAMLGLKSADRLAIYKANQFDIFLFSASAIRIGAIASPINCNVPAAVAARYLEKIGARVLVTDQAGYARLFEDGTIVPPGTIEKIVITDATAQSRQAIVDLSAPLSLSALLELSLPPVPLHALGAEDPLYIVHTSGTTGAPKGVILQSKGLIQSLRSALLFNFVSRRDLAYLAVPLNHQVSQLYLHFVLLLGVRCILNLDFDPLRILHTLEKRRPTVFFGFPITYTRMIASGSDALPLDSVRVWATTADASHEVQQRAFVNKGCFFKQLGLPLPGALFVDGLGSSEVGIAALLRIVTPWTRRFDRRVGYPTPFGPKLKIVDASGNAVSRGDPGRLMIKGACMFAGYWNAHDTLYSSTRDGWWFTGDMVRQDKRGEFIHLDREIDAMHTLHGAVFTLPIEEMVLKYPGVLDTCVFGIRDTLGVDLPAAVVALSDGAPQHAAQMLQTELNANLAERDKLHYLWVIPWNDFPIGATGKTLKRCLRETYGDIVKISVREQDVATQACSSVA
jgi:long-chain acyl-CoA synthetase